MLDCLMIERSPGIHVMARKSAKPQHVEPENESPEATATSGPGKVTKSAAARAALSAGYDNPQKAVAYIKKEFDIEMGAQHFSSVKSQLKKQEEGTAKAKGKPGRKPKAAGAAVEGYLAPPPTPRTHVDGDLIESLETLKPLIAQYGSDKVKRLVDLLG